MQAVSDSAGTCVYHAGVHHCLRVLHLGGLAPQVVNKQTMMHACVVNPGP